MNSKEKKSENSDICSCISNKKHTISLDVDFLSATRKEQNITHKWTFSLHFGRLPNSSLHEINGQMRILFLNFVIYLMMCWLKISSHRVLMVKYSPSNEISVLFNLVKKLIIAKFMIESTKKMDMLFMNKWRIQSYFVFNDEKSIFVVKRNVFLVNRMRNFQNIMRMLENNVTRR